MITETEERFERVRKTAGLFLAPTVFLIIYFLPIPSLNTESHKLLSIVAFTVICWLTECIPIPVAALLGPTLAVIFGVSDVKSVYAPFADPIIILLLGSFIIAKAMSAQGLDRRLAFEILSIKSISRKSASVSLGVGITVALLSMWVSNSAATAMMLPITLGILSALGSVLAKTGEKGISNQGYATGMLLLVAYAASIGGISTPVGTPPNLITLGMLENIEGIKIDFLKWMAIGIPITLVMFLFVWLYMSFSCPSVVKELKGFHSFIYDEKQRLGKWKRGEINVLIAFGVAVVLWVTPGFISIIFGSESEAYKIYNKSLPESVVGSLQPRRFLFCLQTGGSGNSL